MITAVFAPPRTGKTAWITAQALSHMRGRQAREDVRFSRRIIEPLQNNGFMFSLPENIKHLVFADFPIWDKRGAVTSWEINGFDLGLPNKQHKVKFIPPGSVLILDEFQKYLNSRDFQRLADFVSRFYELHGHWYLRIYVAIQRPMLIDKNVRELITEVVEIKEMKHTYTHDLLTRTQWDCRVFSNMALAVRYIESGKTLQAGEKQVYTFNGNIFKHYNAQNFFPFFLRDNYTRESFDMVPSFVCGNSMRDIKLFNSIYTFETPETFGKAR